MSEKMKNIPKCRFPEFVNDKEWKNISLSQIGEIITGNTPSTMDLKNYDGDKLFVSPADISDERYITTTKTTLSEKGFALTRFIKANSILFVCIGSTIGKVAQNKIDCATNQQINSIVPFNKYNNDFIYSSLENNSSKIASMAGNHAVPIINKTLFSTVLIACPSLVEQQRIADCLSSLDSLITAQSQKIELLKEHKKGLLQNLFPKNDENIPNLRFPEFKNDGEWEEKKLGDLLDYEQPTKYLVNDTKYDDSYKTPVLTAGKTFILGYTDETNGIFRDSLPIIIFDDFTTATQFVDFPFKAKSSAMKILKTKSNKFNIKLIFELIQRIDYKADEHKRYWISEYQNITIKLPKPKEQQKIADCLTSIDNEINLQIQKVESLKEHKKALLQQLFPSNEVING